MALRESGRSPTLKSVSPFACRNVPAGLCARQGSKIPASTLRNLSKMVYKQERML